MRKRPIRIEFCLDRTEAKQLEKLVAKSGLNRGSFLRTMIKGYRLHEKPSEEFYEVMRQLSAIGNNMNQLAVKANALGFVDAPMLRNEVKRWEKFQEDVYERFLMPTKGE